jgi:phosphopantothenoylcysteine decarboxylase/phosphopantothenate--cysteine ligase
MQEPDEIFAAVMASAQPKVLSGKRFPADRRSHVRSDRPGPRHHQHELGEDGLRARAGCRRGRRRRDAGERAHALPTPPGVRRIDVTSAAQMAKAVDSSLRGVDAFVAVAAVADYTPAAPATKKVKKTDAPLMIALKPTTDILADVAAREDAPTASGSPPKPTMSVYMPSKSGAERSSR